MKTKMLSIALATIIVFSAFMVVVPVYPGPKEDAIEDGVEWLAGKQNPDGSWGTTSWYLLGETGLAVLKLETHAIQKNIDPFDPDYDYSDEIRLGLDYIFLNAHTLGPIAMQPYGDPDTDGDGIGVYFVSPGGAELTYETGIAMMAIVSSTHPGMVVNVLGSAVDGWKYRHVVEDAVDLLAFGQNDAGTARGGWGYTFNQNPPAGWSDNSNTGYAVLGLAYAQASPPGGFGLTVPDFVKNELDVWVEYIQDDVSGGSGYTSPTLWTNVLKTGNLLLEMAFVGDTPDIPRVRAAIDYLVKYWDVPYRMGAMYSHTGWKNGLGIDDDGDGLIDEDPSDWVDNDLDGLVDEDQGYTASYYQATYCIMKGLEAFGIEEIGGINWTADFETVLLAEQKLDGSWPSSPLSEVHGWSDIILSTEWALLTLEKAVPGPGPVTLEEVKKEIKAIEEKLDFWLPEIKKEIVDIEWKLNYTIDKETVDVQILTGKDMGTGTQILKNKFVYYMMTTVAGQKCNYTKIEIEAESKTIDPSKYKVTLLKTGVYYIEIDRTAVPVGTKLIIIEVECKDPSGVVYYGAALTTAYNV